MNLDHFDTILAFAAVMTGLSLVITALTQAVSALLSLRGFNLKWGLEKLFGTVAPSLGEKPTALVEAVLLHPLLSDSTFAGFRKYCARWRYATHIRPEELSKLFTQWKAALNQPPSPVLEFAAWLQTIRALNLEGPLQRISLNLAQYVPVNVVTQLPPSPLKKALLLPATSEAEKATRFRMLCALSIDRTWDHWVILVNNLIHSQHPVSLPAEVLAQLPPGIQKVLAMPVGNGAEKSARATALSAFDVTADLLVAAASSLAAQIDEIECGVRVWFNTSMDRVSQRFAANTRVVTVAGAALVSVIMQVDSVELWKQLARSPDLRQRIIANSDALLKKADEMQAGTTNPPAAVYRLAADRLVAMHTNTLRGFASTAGITNLTTGTNWLITQAVSNNVTPIAPWLEQYVALVPQAAVRQAVDNLESLLDQHLSLNLIGFREPGESWPMAVWNHLGGIVISIVLLSLGAPFWFNLLRSLSNLRPVLAQKDTQEQQARVKAIAAGRADNP